MSSKIKLSIIPIIVLIIIAGAFGICQADYTAIISSADTYIQSSYPDDNHGSDSPVYAGCYNDGSPSNYALFNFDISGIVGKAIANATLNLYLSGGSNYAGGEIRVYRILKDWDESTVTWNTRPNFNSTPIATITINGISQYVKLDVTDDLRYFADHPEEFHGWLIWFYQEGSNAYIGINSREASSNKPYLEVYYADPKIVTETITTTVTETETTTTTMTSTITQTMTTYTTIVKTETQIIEKKPPAILEEEEEEEGIGGEIFFAGEEQPLINQKTIIIAATVVMIVFVIILWRRWTE